MVSLLTGIIGIAVACLIVWLIRKDRLHVNHGFGWMVAAAGFALLGLAPGITDRVAGWFNVAYPPVLGLTLAIVVLVIKMLLMDIERSRIEMGNQRLTQRVAMLEADVERLARLVSEHKTSAGATGSRDNFP